jgi:hypothetical protein
MTFSKTWLPNVACTFAGCLASWGIGYVQGQTTVRATEIQAHMLTVLLADVERNGGVELARDDNGRITGGRAVRLQAATTAGSTPSK